MKMLMSLAPMINRYIDLPHPKIKCSRVHYQQRKCGFILQAGSRSLPSIMNSF